VFALCNRLYNRNPNVSTFADYINHTILPILWNNPDLVLQINQLKQQIDDQQPKVNFANSIMDQSDYTISLGELAKLIWNVSDEHLGRNELIRLLKFDNYLLEDCSPSQYSINSGLMIYINKDNVHPTARVTPKGQMVFVNAYHNIAIENISRYIDHESYIRAAIELKDKNLINYIQHVDYIYMAHLMIE